MASPTTTTESTLTTEVSDTLSETSGVAAEEVHATEGGLAVLGIDTPFLVAQIVNFFLLFLLLRWVLYRPVLEMLKKRRTTIETSLAQAERVARESASAQQQTAALLAEARSEAKKIVDEAKAQAEAVAVEIRTKAADETERLVASTRTQLEQEKTAIIGKAERELAELVVRATERVVGTTNVTIDPQDVVTALADAKRAA